MNAQEQAYINGFVKRAAECGLTNNKALELLKKADSSFLGRYLASGEVIPSIMSNKQRIMEKLDPAGEYTQNNSFLNEDMIKKQRELAYDHMREFLKRKSAGPYLSNALMGALLGGGAGAAAANGSYYGDPTRTLIGGGIGALAGGALGVGARAIDKHKANFITDEDIARIKAKQKDNSFLSDFVPFKDVIDAAKA